MSGTVDVDMPLEELWHAFVDVERWPRWNGSFWAARVWSGPLRLGATLVWAFNPIRPWYLYKMPVVARIVEYEPMRTVTWEVTALPGFSARHSYRFEADGDQRSRFTSWEVASGPTYRVTRRFWLAHFRFVCGASLRGARRLGGGAVPPVRLVRYGTPTELPPLLMVPGLDGSPGSVAPIAEALAAGREVVVADYEAEQFADLEALSAAVAEATLGADLGPSFDVLGASIGSIVAAQVAARRPDAVRRVVLVGTFTTLRWNTLRVAAVVMRQVPRSWYRLSGPMLMRLVCGPVGDRWEHPFFEATRESDPLAAARRTGWEIDRDFSADLVGFDQAGLVLMGERDRFVPNAAREIDKLRHVFQGRPVEVSPISGAGHVLIPSAAVDTAVARIEKFLG